MIRKAQTLTHSVSVRSCRCSYSIALDSTLLDSDEECPNRLTRRLHMFSGASPSLPSPLFVISPEPLIISDICKLFCSPNYRPRTRTTDGRGSTAAAVTGQGARGARRWQGAHFLAQLGIHNETKDRGRGAGGGGQSSRLAPLSHLPRSHRRQTDRQSANCAIDANTRPPLLAPRECPLMRPPMPHFKHPTLGASSERAAQ